MGKDAGADAYVGNRTTHINGDEVANIAAIREKLGAIPPGSDITFRFQRPEILELKTNWAGPFTAPIQSFYRDCMAATAGGICIIKPHMPNPAPADQRRNCAGCQ